MMSKAFILCSIMLLAQEISGQFLNYGNLQNGLSASSYTPNIAQNSVGLNPYGANLGGNNFANNYGINNVPSNAVSTTNNVGLTNNLASNAAAYLGQTSATNGILNSVANAAPNPINSGTFEGITASNGGIFSVISSSPIVPTGLSVFSDNLLIEGPLTVTGQLPFLSAVAVEGTVASSGQGVAGCGCGDGNVGIVNEVNNAGLYGGMGRPAFGRFY